MDQYLYGYTFFGYKTQPVVLHKILFRLDFINCVKQMEGLVCNLEFVEKGVIKGYIRPRSWNRIIQNNELEFIYQWFQKNNFKVYINHCIEDTDE